MGGGQPRRFYERRCHAPGCGVLFFICRSCYRGQRYCSGPCRQTARREQRRAANRRHQHSCCRSCKSVFFWTGADGSEWDER